MYYLLAEGDGRMRRGGLLTVWEVGEKTALYLLALHVLQLFAGTLLIALALSTFWPGKHFTRLPFTSLLTTRGGPRQLKICTSQQRSGLCSKTAYCCALYYSACSPAGARRLINTDCIHASLICVPFCDVPNRKLWANSFALTDLHLLF